MKKTYLIMFLLSVGTKSFSTEINIIQKSDIEMPFKTLDQKIKKQAEDQKSKAASDAEFQKNIDMYCGKVKSKALPPNPSECLKLVLQQLADVNYPNMANRKGSKPGHADSFCTPDSAEKECQAPDGRVYKLDTSGNQLQRGLDLHKANWYREQENPSTEGSSK